jgi:hypothetical protein
MQNDELKKQLKDGLKQYGQTGLRWSYLIIAGLSVVGAVVNLFLPHGWVIWPVVLAIGIMVMINEATARNNQGLPPLVVYGWFIVALCVWVAAAVIFSAIFPILVIVGIPLMVGYGIYTYLQNRKREKLFAERRAKGLCVHCGQTVDATVGCCEHCGKDLTPDETSLLKRFQAANRTKENVERTRDLLTPKPETVAAKRKEQALLAKSARQSSAARKPPAQQF